VKLSQGIMGYSDTGSQEPFHPWIPNVPQVVEHKEKKVPPVKVTRRTLWWLKERQMQRERETGEKPSYANLLDELVLSAATSTTQAAVSQGHTQQEDASQFSGLSDSERRLLEDTLSVLHSADPIIANALRHNIAAFRRSVREDAAEPQAPSGSQNFDSRAAERRIREVLDCADHFTRETEALLATIKRYAPREKRPRQVERKPHKATG
jgi:hypothetical protein